MIIDENKQWCLVLFLLSSGSQEFLNASEDEEDDPDGDHADHSRYVDDPLNGRPGYEVGYDAGRPAYNSFDDYDNIEDQQSVSSLHKKPVPPSPQTAAFQALRNQNVFDYGYAEPVPVHKDYHSSSTLQDDQFSLHSTQMKDMSFVTHRAKSGQTSDTFIWNLDIW